MIIIRAEKRRRFIAWFFLTITLSTTITPFGYALTGGPSAPEYASFEPVDTTDLVDLKTGDFNYNMPLLEIPGPEGGYPMSLSYHSGIWIDQQSSWVGLGWNINPGCINRNIDGFPDDSFNSLRKIKDYWGGGTTTIKPYTLGVSMSNLGLSLNFGVTVKSDTYRGLSRTYNAGGFFNLPSYLGRGIAQQNALAGLFINSINYGVGGNISSDSKPYGYAILDNKYYSTQKNQASKMATAISTQYNHSLFANGLSFNWKKSYLRYWLDQTDGMYSFGSLYPRDANQYIGKDYRAEYNAEYETFGFDAYSNYDYDSPIADEKNDPERQLGGSYPASDTYEVLGQGIGGVMRPYIFENGNLHKQNIYDRLTVTGRPKITSPLLSYQSIQNFTKDKINFRFINDFSNSLSLDKKVEPISYDGSSLITNPHSPDYVPEGYNLQNQHLAGSKNINWYTNQEISLGYAKTQGLMDYYDNTNGRALNFDLVEDYLQPEMGLPTFCSNASSGRTGAGAYINDNSYYNNDPFDPQTCGNKYYEKSFKPRVVSLKEKIGGFKITNESGVTYHYALPVYAYNEYSRTKMKAPKKGAVTFKEYKNPEPYAYTWLLTGITGPDFFDRNGNGIIDDQDDGYWVKFDYGKWTDSYQWRSPHKGYKTDIEDNYATFSYGMKELYYLDAVETRTHKAIFIKSIRKDGRGVTSRLEGGSNPRRYNIFYKSDHFAYDPSKHGKIEFNVSPVSTLKLDEIYLFNKKDLSGLGLSKSNGLKYNEATAETPYKYYYQGTPNFTIVSQDSKVLDHLNPSDFLKVKYHNGYLVYDDGDIVSNKKLLEQRALKIIRFNTDYSLCKGTPNSFEKNSPIIPAADPYQCLDQFTTEEELEKHFYHKELLGQNVLFNENFCNGESFEYRHTGKLTLQSVEVLGKGGVGVLPKIVFQYSANNPNYSNKYDIWNFYKSDFNPLDSSSTRRPTNLSATTVDAWSLTSIKTATGAQINIGYEADSYSTSEMVKKSTFGLKNVEQLAGDKIKITFKERNIDLGEYFTLNSHVSVHALFCSKNSNGYVSSKILSDNFGEVKCLEIGPDFLVVQNNELFTSASPGEFFSGGFVASVKLRNSIGGGLRTKYIEITDNMSDEYYRTNYNYNVPSTDRSSGVTSFEPYQLTTIKYPEHIDVFDPNSDAYKKDQLDFITYEFQYQINKPYGKVLALAREIPGPGVMYEYVTVSQEGNGMVKPGKTIYNFEVFKESMVERDIQEVVNQGDYKTRIVRLKNFTSQVGNLKSVANYDIKGSKISETINTYLHSSKSNENYRNTLVGSFQGQGMVHQAFNEYRKLRKPDDTFLHRAIVSVREEYPSVLISSTSLDSKNDLKNTTINKAFDFYTGIPTQVLMEDNYGNKYLTESSPAYQLKKSNGENLYSLMGLMVNNPSAKNMLIQEGENYVYKVDNDNKKQGVISASVQTWLDKWSYREQVNGEYQNVVETDPKYIIYRKQNTFDWRSPSLNEDGSAPIQGFVGFNRDNLSLQDPAWLMRRQVTLYDRFSHSLEERDINGNSSAVKLGYKNSAVIASASNARYTEIAYSGAEDELVGDYFGGEVKRGDGNLSFKEAHTGSASLLVAGNGGKGFTFSTINPEAGSKKYRASVWVYSSASLPLAQISYSINNGNIQSVGAKVSYRVGNWYLINVNTNDVPSGATIKVWCQNNGTENTYFDDFRVHPINSVLTTYVYDRSLLELNYILDNNNLFTRYQYDPMGRLKSVHRESFKYGVRRVSDQVQNNAQ